MLSLPRSGSNWVRYWFEYFSHESTSEKNILVEKNHWGQLRTPTTPATLYKRHELSNSELKLREIKKLILVLRDYKECFVRHCIGKNFETRIERLKSYVDNLYLYDSFDGEKLILHYEDFVLNTKEQMQTFLNFLKVKNDWESVNVDYHRNVSLNLYESGGLSHIGKQTRGSPSITRGRSDFQFHQKRLCDETKKNLEDWFTLNHNSIYKKYLSRYNTSSLVF